MYKCNHVITEVQVRVLDQQVSVSVRMRGPVIWRLCGVWAGEASSLATGSALEPGHLGLSTIPLAPLASSRRIFSATLLK